MQRESEIEDIAKDVIHELLHDENRCFTRDIQRQNKNPEDVLILVNDAFKILYDPKIPAVPGTYVIISIISRWLTRYYCRRLMQILTPEGLAVHFSKIPASLRKCYIYHQEHFSLKFLIERHQEKMKEFE